MRFSRETGHRNKPAGRRDNDAVTNIHQSRDCLSVFSTIFSACA